MGEHTEIAWCHHTFNPWWGCVKIAPECTNCYAADQAHRYGHNVWGLTASHRFFGEKHWREPVRWNIDAVKAGERRRVFCASMADVFEDRADLAPERAKLWPLIHATPMLDWLLLTKRPENAPLMVPQAWREAWPSNVWFGTTIGHADRVDNVSHLRAVPAVVRFISAEPLLGRYGRSDGAPTFLVDSELGVINALAGLAPGEVSEVGSPKIDWIILGGESGPKARLCDAMLMRQVIREARQAGTAIFVKQLGARYIDEENGIAGHALKPLPPINEVGRLRVLRDPKGGDMDEWPESMRIREFPR